MVGRQVWVEGGGLIANGACYLGRSKPAARTLSSPALFVSVTRI